jgi:hypothetical protein
MPAVSLEVLQQQITRRESELNALRQELENRQKQLTSLTSRKEDLLAQLHQVEADIAALTSHSARQATVPPKRTVVIEPSSPAAAAAAAQPKLADLIVTMLREAGKALTSRELRAEALRRGYQSSSRNLVKTIEVRIRDLKQQGVVRRASGQPGYILARSGGGVKARTAARSPSPSSKRREKATPPTDQSANPASASKKRNSAGTKTAKSAKATGVVGRGQQPPLREVLTKLLQKSTKLLSGSELAEQALAAGYRTNSKKFVGVVSAALTEMGNVEHVPEKGYRLKKSKAKS